MQRIIHTLQSRWDSYDPLSLFKLNVKSIPTSFFSYVEYADFLLIEKLNSVRQISRRAPKTDFADDTVWRIETENLGFGCTSLSFIAVR